MPIISLIKTGPGSSTPIRRKCAAARTQPVTVKPKRPSQADAPAVTAPAATPAHVSLASSHQLHQAEEPLQLLAVCSFTADCSQPNPVVVSSFPVPCGDANDVLSSDTEAVQTVRREAKAKRPVNRSAGLIRASKRRTTSIKLPIDGGGVQPPPAHDAQVVGAVPVAPRISRPAQPRPDAEQFTFTQWLTSMLTLLTLVASLPAAVQLVRHTTSRALASTYSPAAPGPAWSHVSTMTWYAAGAARGLEATRSLLQAPSSVLGFASTSSLNPLNRLLPGWARTRVVARAAGRDAAGLVGDKPPREWLPSAKVRVVSLAPATNSPYKAPWDQVLSHISQRLAWSNPSFQMHTFTEQELLQPGGATWSELQRLLTQGCQVLLGADVTDPVLVAKLGKAAQAGLLPQIRLFLGAPALPIPAALQQINSLQGYQPQSPNVVDALLSQLPWSSQAKSAQLWTTVQALWGRHSSDDLLFVYLVLINQYLTPVPEVAMTTKGFDFDSLKCMIQNCRQQIVDCVSNPVCKAGLDCLQGCSFNDQVCQYRCIVSYETPEFAAFSLCILQKHNCRSLDAKPPLLPDPAPMSTFRGAPLTHEIAEDMLVGWMPPNPGLQPGQQPLVYSWLVAAGKNPAYDFFPCQHQYFYRGKGPGVLWYEPIFKAITLDGRQVWRRRRYRVKRGKTPGTFHFTVLDNGVTSNEFWRILDCDEAYSWCLFYYSGAASAAGLSYSGAVLGTADGRYLTSRPALDRLEQALDRAGIKPWELSFVDNTACAGSPLPMDGQPA